MMIRNSGDDLSVRNNDVSWGLVLYETVVAKTTQKIIKIGIQLSSTKTKLMNRNFISVYFQYSMAIPL